MQQLAGGADTSGTEPASSWTAPRLRLATYRVKLREPVSSQWKREGRRKRGREKKKIERVTEAEKEREEASTVV